MEKSFYNTIPEEQETTINIIYDEGCIHIYTSRNGIYLRLLKKIGEPTKKYYSNNKICGAMWKIPFSDKRKITSALSRPLLIGNIK